MYNTLNINNLKFNLLIDIKYPNSNSFINKYELSVLKKYKTGILEINKKVGKLEFEAIRLFNEVNAFQAIIYTHENDIYSSNKHIHAMLSYKKNQIEDIIHEIVTSIGDLKQIRKGKEIVLCKELRNDSNKNKIFKDTMNIVPFWEFKGNGLIYYIAPIVIEENMYTYINKYQNNPYNNLNYISK